MTENTLTYRMVGRQVRVEYDGSAGSSILREELSRYPHEVEETTPDLTVRYRPVDSTGPRFVNPRVHDELESGFVVRDRMATTRFEFRVDRLERVDFYPEGSSSPIVRQARRLADMQFSSREQRSGVIFHESVLAPAVHWMTDVALVHASAFSAPEGGVTLVGGTGGVGKTSIALELCMHRGYRFVADDISFVSADGRVWPNLAYPKIYAYNLEDNPALAARVLGGRSVADRLHWMMHRRRGPQFVRRRVAPDALYGTFDSEGGPLARYVVLARAERGEIDVEQIDAERAAGMTISLMQPEYQAFHNHLHWHAFNRAAAGREASIRLDAVLSRWHRLLSRVLKNAACLLVTVPLSIRHEQFKQELAAILTDGDR